MTEDFEDIQELTPKERAGMRWRAIEAFNCAPGLSPMARRVGAALMYATNAETLLCCPSELYIAAELGVNLTSVKNAKAELGPRTLRSLGKVKGYRWIGVELISWHHPRGPMSSCHYSFNWPKLMALAAEAKKRAETAVNNRRAERQKGSKTTTYVGCDIASPDLGNAPVLGSHLERQGSQSGSLGGQSATLKVATPLPEPPINITTKEVAQHNTHSQANGAVPKVDDSEELFVSQSAPPPMEPKSALETRKKRPTGSKMYFQQLVDELCQDDSNVTNVILRLGFDSQFELSKVLATKGKEAALAHIREHFTKGVAA